MDPLAHTLFGAALAETGLRRKTTLATATLIIGANAPDIDALAMFVSSDYALLVRRGWTHGLPALLIWPFLITGLMLAVDLIRFRCKKGFTAETDNGNEDSTGAGSGRVLPVRLFLLATLAVWSHPFLDWLNTYGIRLFMPLDGQWFYGDTLFIVDPWMWLLMGSSVVLARSSGPLSISGWLVVGLLTTALVLNTGVVTTTTKVCWILGVVLIGWMRWSGLYQGRENRIAATGLMLFLLYLLLMYTGSRLTAWQVQEYLSDKQISVERVMAEPLPGRILLRHGVAASDTHYYLFRLNWLQAGSIEWRSEPLEISSPNKIVEAALELPEVAGLANWIRFPHYEVQETSTGWRVYIRDLRYADPGQEEAGIGIAVVDLDRELHGKRIR